MDPVPGVRLYRVEGSLPRVYLARAATVLPDTRAHAAVLAPAVIAGERAVLATSPPPPRAAALLGPAAPDRGTCRLLAWAHTRLEAECTAPVSTLAVFVEQFEQGWTAALDARATPLLRANIAMRAVAVPPGRHRIVLTFSPPGLRVGMLLSIVSLCALLLILAGCAAFARHRDWPSDTRL
jgi:hypothetical protein